jgi:hypothetical protein
VLRDGSDIVGIAPFWQYEGVVREVPTKRIEFILSPDSPFVDFLVRPERRDEVLEALVSYLYTEKRDMWDVLSLTQWPITSPNYAVLQELLRKQTKESAVDTDSRTPFIPIQEPWANFLQGRSVRFRKTHRNINNRIERLPGVEIQCIQGDTDGTVLSSIFSVSQNSWKVGEGIALTSKTETREFFRLLTACASEHGWLMVWLLKIENHAVAMEYDLIDEKKVYALRADYDEAYKEYSPGAYLEYHIVKHLFEKGYSEYNTGPGMNSYKLHWTEAVRENASFLLCNNTIKGRMIAGLENRLLPFLRRIRDLGAQAVAGR